MNNYYPFGMRFNQAPVVNKQDNNYLYNGKELQQFGLDWYDYGARMYDAVLGRFTGIDPIAEDFYYVTPYNYAENDPVGAIDLWGLQKLKIAGNFALTTGKVGGNLKAFDFGIGGSYTKGGASQGIEVYIEVNTKTGEINLGASHIQKTVHGGHSVQYGPFHGSESEEKVTKRDLSTKNGATKPIDDKVYKDKESGGLGPIKVEETDEGTTVKADVSKAEVNALIVGVELGTSIEYTQEKNNNNSTENSTGNNTNKNTKTNVNDDKYVKNHYVVNGSN